MTTRAILMFAFNRPQYFSQVLEGLKNQNWKDFKNDYVFIAYLDGPRKPEDVPLIDKNEELLKSFPFPVEIHRNKENKYIDAQIFNGLYDTFVKKKIPSAIIVEEDIVPLKGFLEWMEWGLDNLVETGKAQSVLAFSDPKTKNLDPAEFKLTKWFTPWGWATTAKAWIERFQQWIPMINKGMEYAHKVAISIHPNIMKSRVVDIANGKLHIKSGWDNFTNMIYEINELVEASPLVPRSKNIGKVGAHQDGKYLWPELIDRVVTSDEFDLVKTGFRCVS